MHAGIFLSQTLLQNIKGNSYCEGILACLSTLLSRSESQPKEPQFQSWSVMIRKVDYTLSSLVVAALEDIKMEVSNKEKVVKSHPHKYYRINKLWVFVLMQKSAILSISPSFRIDKCWINKFCISVKFQRK